MNVLKFLKKHLLILAILIFSILFITSGSSEAFQSQGNIYVFYHIYCNENTEKIVHDQIIKILFSGLYNDVSEIKCFLVGEEQFIQKIQALLNNSGKKFKVEEIGVNDKTYERFTLLKIKKFITTNDKILYIHSKGVTKPDDENIYYWRTLMEYFLFAKYKECLELLNSVDVVGLPYKDVHIGPHFSGNFWWTNASYFLTLPDTIGQEYNEPELYIFTKKPTYKDIGESVNTTDNFYTTSIYPKSYIDL